jgi:hypothetical protein
MIPPVANSYDAGEWPATFTYKWLPNTQASFPASSGGDRVSAIDVRLYENGLVFYGHITEMLQMLPFLRFDRIDPRQIKAACNGHRACDLKSRKPVVFESTI